MKRIGQKIQQGHYARKQLLCAAPLIAWSHRSRFQVGLQISRRFRGQTVLDYGCGDGTFLALLMGSRWAPSTAVGAELAPAVIADCQERLSSPPALSFLALDELALPRWQSRFDAIICMEVLEHVIDWRPLFESWKQLLTPDGYVLVSVPVETGLPLLVKQIARRIAGWRGLGDYPGQHPYTPKELVQGLFAGENQHIVRPTHPVGPGGENYDHKGFNWRVLLKALSKQFEVEKVTSSPVRSLPPSLASQAWFLARSA
jgi:SAM-dependent methyltransferase